MLSQMSLGVVGYGRLGKKVASYGQCFGMKVGCFDPYVSNVPTTIQRHNTLASLVSASDVISVHVPHEPETENMFNSSVFENFKPGSFFINTSRGELVDHQALRDVLEKKLIAGAAVDVLENEFEHDFQQRVSEQPLVQYAATHPNLIITPHIGGSTYDAWHLTQEHTIKMIIGALQSV